MNALLKLRALDSVLREQGIRDHAKEAVVGDKTANGLVTAQYRKPWKLPYLKVA